MRERAAGDSEKERLIDELEAELQQSAAKSACRRCEKAICHLSIGTSKFDLGWIPMVCTAGVPAEYMSKIENCTDESHVGPGTDGGWVGLSDLNLSRTSAQNGSGSATQRERQTQAQNFLNSRLRPAPGRGD